MEAMPTVSSSVEKLPQIPHISLTQRHQTIRHPEKCSKPENDAICGLRISSCQASPRLWENKARNNGRDSRCHIRDLGTEKRHASEVASFRADGRLRYR